MYEIIQEIKYSPNHFYKELESIVQTQLLLTFCTDMHRAKRYAIKITTLLLLKNFMANGLCKEDINLST